MFRVLESNTSEQEIVSSDSVEYSDSVNYCNINDVGDDVWNLRDSMCDRSCSNKDSTLRSRSNLTSSFWTSKRRHELLTDNKNASVGTIASLTGIQTVQGLPILDDGDLTCTYGNQLKCVPYALFSQRDLNKMSTATLITKDYDRKYNAGWRVGTKMRGRTQFGKYSFPFPTNCSPREFTMFLTEMSNMTRSEKQALYVEGTISTERVASAYAKVFPRSKTEVYAMGMDDLFNGVEVLSTIILIFKAILKKEVDTLSLLFMQQAKRIAVVAEYMGSNYSTFKEYCIGMFYSDSPTEVSSAEVGDFSDWMHLLPGYVKQSQLVQKVIRLASCLMSVQFVRDSSLWEYVVTLASPDFTKVTSTAFCSVLFYQVVTALWEGFKRMEHFTDWRNLIGLSKDAYFKEQVQAIYAERLGSASEREILEKIHQIDSLIATRQGLIDSPDIERKINFLIDRKKHLLENLADYRPRQKPILIWLNGPPGTGKTTLMNALSDFLAKRDGFERKLGDTIIYNIHDKYPVEAASNFDAKFVQINDIANNYKNYQMEGKVPLDVLLQQVIDTSPLTFQSAFVKGVIYNHIKYVFISSNYYNYAFSSDTEKLQRRLDDSIILDIKFTQGDYQQVAKHDILDRNDHLKAVVMYPTCIMDKVTFGHTSVSYPLPEVFSYIAQKVDQLTTVRGAELVRFHTAVCTCGVAPAFHLRNRDYVSLSPLCDIASFAATSGTHCKFGKYKENHDPFVVDCVETCGDRSYVYENFRENVVGPSTVPEFPLSIGEEKEEEYSDNPFDIFCKGNETHEAEVHGLITLSIWYGALGYTIFSLFPYVSTLKFYLWLCKLNVKAVMFDLLVGCILHTDCFYRRTRYEYFARVLQIQWGLKATILRIQAFIQKHKVPIAALGVATVVGFGVSRYSPKAKVQGANRQNYNVDSLTTTVLKTVQVMETNARSWVRTDPDRKLEIQTKNTSLDDLAALVRNNTRSAIFVPADAGLGTSGASGFLFSLDSNRVLVNKHYMLTKIDDKYVLRDTLVILEDRTSFKLLAADVIENDMCEVVCVTCTHFKTVPNLSKFLLGAFPENTSFDATYVPTGQSVVVKTEKVKLSEYDVEYPALCAKLATSKGDCGNVLIGYHRGSAFIAGVLFAGTSHLTGHITHFSFIPVGPAVAVRLIVPEPENLERLDPGSEGNNDRHEHLIPLGTNPSEGREGFRGMLKESRFYEALHGKLSEPYYFPKKISGNVALPGEPYQHASAWKHTFKRFDLPNEGSHAQFLEAVLSYTSNFDSVKVPTLAPLTLAQAFFGEPSIGVEPFPMKTSTGPYWRKRGYPRKENLFVLNEETGEYHLVEEFRASVQHGLDLLDEGVVVAPLVELVAKDEVRPVRKLKEYNVRLFSVLDVDYNIIVRMYMMPLVVFLLKEKGASECFGQMHAASPQWTDLYNYLVEPGFSKFADMDFSAFDTCHDEKVFLAVSYVMMILAAKCGYPDRDVQKVGMLVQSMGTQVCQYKGDYFLKTKGMPSGVILTLIINSIANSLLMRVVFQELTGKPQSEFRDHVRLATVGDDNIHSFSEEIAPMFTMAKAQPVYKSLGYTITPASKGDILVDYMPLEDLVFVKRRFVLWEDGYYRAPIDTDSIYKAFCFEPKGGDTTSVERLRNVFTSGVYEAYLHGRDFFDTFVNEMTTLYDEHNIPYTLITFEELNDIFLSRGLTTAFA